MWWLEEPEMANRSNAQLRKDKYKRFWTMLFHRNVWKIQDTGSEKKRALQHDPRRKNYVNHKRDIMPKCVIDLVRHWLPNLYGSHVAMIYCLFFVLILWLCFLLPIPSIKSV